MVFILYYTKDIYFYALLVSQRPLHVATNHVITQWPRWYITKSSWYIEGREYPASIVSQKSPQSNYHLSTRRVMCWMCSLYYREIQQFTENPYKISASNTVILCGVRILRAGYSIPSLYYELLVSQFRWWRRFILCMMMMWNVAMLIANCWLQLQSVQM